MSYIPLKSYSLSLIILALVLLNGCDGINNPSDEISTEVFTNTEKRPDQVRKNHRQDRRSFDSEDEYFRLLDRLERGEEEFVVNESLYNSFRHAYTAAEISLFDMNGEVEIDGYVYKIRREALYRFRSGTSRSNMELIQYYGHDGQHDIKEKARITGHYLLNGLQDINPDELRDPSAKELYFDLVNAESGKIEKSGIFNQEINSSSAALCFSYGSFDTCFIGTPFIINYGGDTYDYQTQVFNESYSNGTKKRGRGYTLAWVRRPAFQSNFESMLDLGTYGANASGTIGERFLLEVWVQTNSGTDYDIGFGYAYESRPRSSNTGTESEHSADIKLNANSAFLNVLDMYELD